ncbi:MULTISPECIES: HEAT repeat domain-containing protein [unclassified Duganella]|uniref:HEAT repeat domain-containing protein n=1 Tax=unclassified Duganella TaxID=2636909 RepID=UPI000E34BA2F|nr:MULTISPECIES: HEAT repeat domain-containing protein [unclassified Duganella]RFP07945.1 HEAT repeat domain-containing protein [Duganella sp. BJB475]RFP21018.1 HEAT repeat domain-containing protein [Duganella sp. BJB476]
MPTPLLPYLSDGIKTLIEPVQPEIVLSLLKAIEMIAVQHQPDKTVVNDVVLGVSSHRVPVYETASYILGDLAAYSSVALQAIIELSHSTDSRVRHNAVLCLTGEMPQEVVHEMLGRALRDKSSRVRRKAADWAGRLGCRAVLPAMQEALKIEKNVETREVMHAETQRFAK